MENYYQNLIEEDDWSIWDELSQWYGDESSSELDSEFLADLCYD